MDPNSTIQVQQTEATHDQFAFVNKIYEEMNYNTDSQLTSSSEFEFLTSTDPTEADLSDRQIRKRTDSELMAPIQGPESQLKEAQDLWGSKASTSLENILTSEVNIFDDLFMKHKADICRCTIAKYPVEVEPGAVPHSEGARRMSPEKFQSRSTQSGRTGHDSAFLVTLGKWDCHGKEKERRITLLF